MFTSVIVSSGQAAAVARGHAAQLPAGPELPPAGGAGEQEEQSPGAGGAPAERGVLAVRGVCLAKPSHITNFTYKLQGPDV